MKKMLTAMIPVAIFLPLHGQERTAITDDGQKIIVRSDGTWYPLDDPHWTPEGSWILIPNSAVGGMGQMEQIQIKKMQNGRYDITITEGQQSLFKPLCAGHGGLLNFAIKIECSGAEGKRIPLELTFSKGRAHLRVTGMPGDHKAEYHRW